MAVLRPLAIAGGPVLLATAAAAVLLWPAGPPPREAPLPVPVIAAPGIGVPGIGFPGIGVPGIAALPEPVAAPRFDVARLGRNGMMIAAGRAAPDAEVTLRDNGHEIGRGRADARGEWVILPSGPVPAGARELTLEMRLPGAPAPVPGENSVVLLAPEPPPPPPASESSLRPSAASAAAPRPPAALAAMPAATAPPPRGEDQPPAPAPPPAPLALLLPRAQAAPVVALQAPPAGLRLSLDLVDYDAEGAIRFAGAAPPGAPLRLYAGARHLGDAAADAAGRWSLAAAQALPPGRHALRVDQVDARGRVVARVEQPFLRETALAARAGLAEGRHVVQPGNTLWRLAREHYGQGMRFTVIFAANREQIRDPDRIFPGQVFTVPAPAPSSRSR